MPDASRRTGSACCGRATALEAYTRHYTADLRPERARRVPAAERRVPPLGALRGRLASKRACALEGTRTREPRATARSGCGALRASARLRGRWTRSWATPARVPRRRTAAVHADSRPVYQRLHRLSDRVGAARVSAVPGTVYDTPFATSPATTTRHPFARADGARLQPRTDDGSARCRSRCHRRRPAA